MADGEGGNAGEGGGGEGDSELEPAGASFILDPNLQHTIEIDYAHPVCGGPTQDPNRYTIHVPTDETVLSLGKGSEAQNRIKDDGITGRTKKHIHFHVKEEDKTFVTMGGPSLDAGVCSWTGDGIAAENEGYSMVTDGHAWHESKETQTITSADAAIHLKAPGAEGDIVVQSDQAAVFAFGKEIGIAAKESVSIGAHAAAAASDIGYKQTFTNQWWPNRLSKVGSFIATAGEIGTGILAIIRAQKKQKRAGEKGKPGFEEGKASSNVKAAVDSALSLSTIIRAGAEFNGTEVKQSVGISADNFIGITAGIGATMYGQASSAIISVGQAEVLGGVSALVKALGWTEITGTQTALTALRNVEVAATNGEIEMSAKTEVKISSYTDEVLITAEKNVQLVSNTENVYVWGLESALLGTEGYAFQATKDELTFGKATAPKDFKAPAIDPKNVFKMNSDETSCYRGAAGFALRDNKVTLMTNGRAGELILDGDKIQVQGNRILLG
jgi:hypothetical protein